MTRESPTSSASIGSTGQASAAGVSDVRRWLLMAGAALACALVLVTAWWSYRVSAAPRRMVGVVAAAGTAVLDVADQSSPVGKFVVRRVVAPDDSWIVVTNPDADDPAAERVGIAHVAAGESRNVSIALAPTVPLNQKLVVTLHADRGTRGRFEFDAERFDESPDKPFFAGGAEVSRTVVKDSTLFTLAESAGGSVAQEAQVPAGAATLDMSNRLTVLDDLVVDAVVAPGPSWIAVYSVDGEGYSSALAGIVHVRAGRTEAVKVPIDPNADLTDKLLVVLHADAGTVGRFEFSFDDFSGTPDKPYAVGGSEVGRTVFWRGYGMGTGNAGSGGGM